MLLNTNKNLAVYRNRNHDEIVTYMSYQIVEEILREERPKLFDHKFVSILLIYENHYINPLGELRRWYEICVSYHLSKLSVTAGGYENIKDLDIKVRDKKLKKIIDESNLST
jgi:hypothetical protein